MVLDRQGVQEYIAENDVRFIRLQFCDIFGTLKNISIMPSQLERAFNEGIGFDASSIRGFLNETESDLLLIPDPSTMCRLPWRPQQGRVVRLFCNIVRPDGTSFEGDCRAMLNKTINKAKEKGYIFHIGPECEFYLFKTDENGSPLQVPHDQATYFDVAPADKGENVRREICLTLDEMGLEVETSHHENGPGQHEIVFRYGDGLKAADDFTTFRTVVKTVAGKYGLYASFMPKPMAGFAGSGLHINVSVKKDDRDFFRDELTKEGKSVIAGVLSHIKGICAFSNPLVNSYKRIGSGFEAPSLLNWGCRNRSHLVRIPATGSGGSRMELRCPDPASNPYLVFATLIASAVEGIENNLQIDSIDTAQRLPSSLIEALEYAKADSLLRNVVGDYTFSRYISSKEKEWNEYVHTVQDWEIQRYFYNI